jgi:molybdopterin molybdotransferase
MLELEQAQQHILSLVLPLASERVTLDQAAGRFLAEHWTAPLDLPPFDNSAMDGYAVRAEDVQGASRERAIPLQIIGQSAAGQTFDGRVGQNQCVRVFTGSALPLGADAVVMQEDTETDATAPAWVKVQDAVKPFENVRLKSEDVQRGTLIAAAGDRLGAGQIALLGALGCAEIAVRQQPVLGMIATGSELRPPGVPLAPGQIYESNRITLATLARTVGAQPKVYPVVADDLTATCQVLANALAECDAVVTSGGVSVGELDLVKAAFEELGGSWDFWRVKVRPGKPFALGQRERKLVFGLPGNPVSAFVTFVLLVQPALLGMQGARNTEATVSWGTLAETLENLGDRRHFVRVKVDASGAVRSSGVQGAHMLRSLAGANGLVDVPPKTSLRQGQPVPVIRWDQA